MARRFEAESRCFIHEAFANYIQNRIDEELGVVVVGIAEVWIGDHAKMDFTPPPPSLHRHPRQ